MLIFLAQEDELLHEAIMDSDIVNVDSFLPTKFLLMKGYKFHHRVPTPEVFVEFMKCANEKGQSIFLWSQTKNA